MEKPLCLQAIVPLRVLRSTHSFSLIPWLEELSRLEHKDKSTVARRLIDYGWEFLMLKYYKDGKLSLEVLSRKLDLSLSETMDLLAEQGEPI